MIKSIVFACIVIVTSVPSFAQDTSYTEEHVRIGVGVSYSPFEVPGDQYSRFETAGMTDFFVPMQFGPYIRFEPEVGLFFRNYMEAVPDSAGSFTRTANTQIVRTGFGVFYTSQIDKSFQCGLGFRIGIMSSETETHQANANIQDTDAHYAIFYLGGAFTVEYFISKHFSVGGELQFIDYSYGSPLVTVGTNPLSGYGANTPTQDVWSTNEVLSARFWF